MLELLKAIGQAYAEEFQAPKESRIESRVRECVSPGREDKFMEVCGGRTSTWKHELED
jgi:hypothetical protein